jgi:hypothetical protein
MKGYVEGTQKIPPGWYKVRLTDGSSEIELEEYLSSKQASILLLLERNARRICKRGSKPIVEVFVCEK